MFLDEYIQVSCKAQVIIGNISVANQNIISKVHLV